MAFTFTRETAKKSEVQGSTRTVFGIVTADAGSGVVQTSAHGLKYIFAGSVTPRSAATGGFNVKFNAATAGAALNGSLNIASCAAGDDFAIILYGR